MQITDYKQHPIFSGLSENEFNLLNFISQPQPYSKNAVVFAEGEKSDDLYLLLKGKVLVKKYDQNKKMEFSIDEIHTGDVFGDMSFVDTQARSATVVVVEPSIIYTIQKKKLLELGQEGNNIYNRLIKNIAKINIMRLRKTSINYVETMRSENEQLQLRAEFGRFFITLIAAFSIASFITKFAIQQNIIKNELYLFHWFYMLLVFFPTAAFIYEFHYSLNMFGVTLKNWKQSLLEGLLISAAVLIAGITAAHFLAQKFHYVFRYDNIVFTPLYLNYLASCYLQEFIVRGVTQTSLQRFLNDKNGYLSITVTSSIFATFHIWYSLRTSFAIFIISVFLGWIYNRHKNLLGVGIIHFIIGALGDYYGLIT